MESVPLLSEALPQQLADVNLAFGGLANASGLGRLFMNVRHVLAGGFVEDIRRLAHCASCCDIDESSPRDARLRRECAFAGGFMVDLEEHAFTDLLPSAIGHSSGIVPTFALCDPEHEVTIVCVLNGVSPSPDDLREFAGRSSPPRFERSR